MSRLRIAMEKLIQILRLSYDCDLPVRCIAVTLGLSVELLNKVLSATRTGSADPQRALDPVQGRIDV